MTIKIAIVGCGRISQKHIDAIQHQSEKFELIAVCDNNPKALENSATKLGVKGYHSLSDLLSQSDAQIISLCTPSGIHPQQAIQIARAGKHVVTEKPMATRWQDGLDMVRACDDAGVKLFVVKQNRFNPTIQKVKQAIQDKAFGRIYMVQSNVFWTRPQAYYDQGNWRGTWEFDGGALMNQASHYVDLMEWLSGPVESVQAMTATLAREIEVEDTASVNIKYRSGALGNMAVTMLTYPKNLEGSITLLGEKGTVKIGGIALNEVHQWEFESYPMTFDDVSQSQYDTDSVYGNGHVPYYENVADVLLNDADMATCGREGLRSLELLIAMYLSARSGRTEYLPLSL